MSDQDTKDAAVQTRIITHMNADHHDSVIRYLQYYHSLSSTTAYTGQMTAITLSAMTISCREKQFTVPFDPPMTSYRDARQRLVEMDGQCRTALGQSDIVVTTYDRPTGLNMALFCIVLCTLVAFSSRDNFGGSGHMATLVSRLHLPDSMLRFCRYIQPALFWGMLALHGAEALWFVKTRLLRHGVNARSAVFWLWIGDVFVEGVGGIYRFNELVRRLEREKAAMKH